jgi:hypothetical protein
MKPNKPNIDIKEIDTDNFLSKALEIFYYQAKNNSVYKEYIAGIGCEIDAVDSLDKIPFLPIGFFKTHQILSDKKEPKQLFLSSGTTNTQRSKHLLTDISLYERSFKLGFKHFFGDSKDYTILALLPSYLEQGDSSLVYMVKQLIDDTGNSDSGFYLNDYNLLIKKLNKLDKKGKKVLLIGVSYALLDLVDKQKFNLKNTLIMETGGMKGRRKEMIKRELHQVLQNGFGVPAIYSEYGMTELLSQAYSMGDTLFITPPWMQVLIREVEDPLSILPIDKSGGINVIDLANINSCSFIATQDLGRIHTDGSFEVLGRFDHSDIRGCNLMV